MMKQQSNGSNKKNNDDDNGNINISGNKTGGGLHTNIEIKLKNYSNWQLYYEIIDHLNKWL